MPNLDLAYCMTLPPKQAVAYLRSKGMAITWDWEEQWQEAHAQAFTVAKVTRLDILEDIRSAVQQAIDEGKTSAWFEKELTPVLQGKGWWGTAAHVDPDTGEVSQVQLGSPWRLQTIYRTNLQTAYMAGRFQALLENVDERPYWMYVAILDGKTRPGHRAMNGKVLRYDDPFWQSFYPPNGWGCRCRVVALSARDVLKLGIVVESSAGKLGHVQSVSAKTGARREVATYKAVDPATQRQMIVSPDIGWSYNAGAAAWQPELHRYTGDLDQLARRELS